MNNFGDINTNNEGINDLNSNELVTLEINNDINIDSTESLSESDNVTTVVTNNGSHKQTYGLSRAALYILIIFIFYIGSTICLYMAFSTEKQTTVYLKESATVDDTISLKENNYYEEDYLKNQNKYISALIDKITLDFNYGLTLSDEIDYDISYYADALLYVHEVDHPENILWKSERNLITKTNINNNDKNELKLNQSIEIDYNEYDQLVKEFIKNYVLITDSKLKIDLHIVMDCVDEDYSDEFDYEKVVTVEIPMNEQTISLTKDNDDLNNFMLNTSTKTFNMLSAILLCGGIACTIVAAIFLFKLFILLKDYMFRITPYQRALDRILSTYDHLIVSATAAPSLEGLNVIEVTKFEELLDAQEELRMPIVYYEMVENKKSIFVIINNTNACVYYLKESN